MRSKSAKSKSNAKGRSRGPVRYAVVGLGYISQAAVLPAFAHASSNSVLTALVSGDGTKLKRLGRKYKVSNLYRYKDFDECLESGEVDAVYIALPNNMHCEYSVRAAQAGIHVLCEKPMAVNSAECQQMIDAARSNGVRLMIAYRLHFEAANLRAVEISRSGKLGRLRVFNSLFTMSVKSGDIRLKAELGGGTLYDIGIYCINAARYLFRDEPHEVFAASAQNGDRRFREVDEMSAAILRFPDDRLAMFTSSFGATDTAVYQIVGTNGHLRLEQAYEYAEALEMETTIREKTTRRTFPKRDQFAPELAYFSDCVRNRKDPEPSGEEGLADVRIIEALYESAATGRTVALPPYRRGKRPSQTLEMKRPPVRMPELVNARPPSLAK